MSGWLALGLSTLICGGLFLSGLRFARMDRNPWAGRRLLGMPIRGSHWSVGQVRLMGRFFMIFAPLFWALFAAMCFGLLGLVRGIDPISFN